MIKSVTLAFAAIVGLSAGAARAASDFTIPVDKDFWEDNITWTGGFGKAYDFRWLVIGQKGMIAVCGVGHFNDPTTRSASKDLMRNAEVLVNGKSVLKNITFFNTVKKDVDLSKASANCRMTGTPEPKGEYKIRLKMEGSARF